MIDFATPNAKGFHRLFDNLILDNVPRILSGPNATKFLSGMESDLNSGSFRMPLLQYDAEDRFTGNLGEPVLITDANSKDALATIVAMFLDGEHLYRSIRQKNRRNLFKRNVPIPSTDGQWLLEIGPQFIPKRQAFDRRGIRFHDGMEVPQKPSTYCKIFSADQRHVFLVTFPFLFPGFTTYNQNGVHLLFQHNQQHGQLPHSLITLPATSHRIELIPGTSVVTGVYKMHFYEGVGTNRCLWSLARHLGLDVDPDNIDVQAISGAIQKGVDETPFLRVAQEHRGLTIFLAPPDSPSLFIIPEGLKTFWDIANGTA